MLLPSARTAKQRHDDALETQEMFAEACAQIQNYVEDRRLPGKKWREALSIAHSHMVDELKYLEGLTQDAKNEATRERFRSGEREYVKPKEA